MQSEGGVIRLYSLRVLYKIVQSEGSGIRLYSLRVLYKIVQLRVAL